MTPPPTGTASFFPCWTDSGTLPIGDWNAETGEGRESVEVATRPVKVVPLPSLGVTGSITVTSSSLSSLLLDSSLLDSVMYVVLSVPNAQCNDKQNGSSVHHLILALALSTN